MEKEKNSGERNEEAEEKFIITEQDIERAISRLKKKKAAEEDRMNNEAWINADNKTKRNLKDIMQKICNRKQIPEGWKEGWIFSIYKNGDKQKAENYRGITLMDAGYKIFAIIIEGKLRKETERLGILPEIQAGFRKKRSGIIYQQYIHIKDSSRKRN